MMAAPGGAGEVSFLDLDGSYKGCNIFGFFTLSNVLGFTRKKVEWENYTIQGYNIYKLTHNDKNNYLGLSLKIPKRIHSTS